MENTGGLPGSQSIKILRIKRKRDEEFPEMLVVEPTKRGSKRRKSALDIFQFAETLDASAWRSMQEDELRNRISLMTQSGTTYPKKALGSQTTSSHETINRKISGMNNPTRQYRVVTDDSDSKRRMISSSRSGPLPPKVISSKDLNKPTSKLTIYDAVLESSPLETTPDMDKFQSLLKDYLTISDSTSGLTNSNTVRSNLSSSSRVSTSNSLRDSGEYVYDIFYYRPSTLAEQAAAAGMATVTGLPVEFEDDYELASDSEPEDEADEDSNDENFYKNDYPDEESSDEHAEDDDFDYHSSDGFDDSDRFVPGN